QQGRWYLEAKCFRGLEIYGELELCRCLYRQIIRLLSVQDAIHVRSRASNNFSSIRSIGDQRAFCNELPKTVDRRESVSHRHFHDQSTVIIDECIRCGDQTTGRFAREQGDDFLDLHTIVHWSCRKLDADRRSVPSKLVQESWIKRRAMGIK